MDDFKNDKDGLPYVPPVFDKANLERDRRTLIKAGEERKKAMEERKKAEIDALCRLAPCNDDQCEGESKR